MLLISIAPTNHWHAEGKLVRHAGLASSFPPDLPCVCPLFIFIRDVFQFFTLSIRLIPAANSMPVISKADLAIFYRNVRDNLRAFTEPEYPSLVRRVEAHLVAILHKIAYPIVAHAGISRHRQENKYSSN